VRGYDKVEEYDPIERLRRLEGAGAPGRGSDGSGAGGQGRGGGPGPGSAGGGGGLKSLEEELAELTASVNLKDFDYKPVPRRADDE
jgi:hypothetical protein